MKAHIHKLALLAVAVLVFLPMVACGGGGYEDSADTVEEAVEDAKDAAEEAVDEAQDMVDDIGDEAEDVGEEIEEAVDEATGDDDGGGA